MQAAIQTERDRTEKLLAEAAERQREMEERTRKDDGGGEGTE